jgi:hypothetical protein
VSQFPVETINIKDKKFKNTNEYARNESAKTRDESQTDGRITAS